jgi:hypothetical protein
VLCSNPRDLQALRINGDTRRNKEEKADAPKRKIAPRAPRTPTDDVVEVRGWKYSDYCKGPGGSCNYRSLEASGKEAPRVVPAGSAEDAEVMWTFVGGRW